MWMQSYVPVAGSVLLSALVAGVPLYTLFYLLAVRRQPAHWAGLAALAVAIVTAVLVFGMPALLAVDAALMGAAFALFPIMWIVVNALFLYRLTVVTGRFEAIRRSIVALSDDRRIQALVIAFCFGALIEGIAGFGTPVALSAAMLVGIGFDPRTAVVLSLLANTAPVAYGNLGIPIISLAGVIQPFLVLPRDELTLALSAMVGRQIPILSFLVPALLVVVMSGWRGLRGVLPAVLVAGGGFAVTQFLVANFVGPVLADVLAAIVALAALVALLRLWQPSALWRVQQPSPVAGAAPTLTAATELPDLELPAVAAEPAMARGMTARDVAAAWMPFAVLVAFVVIGSLAPVARTLDTVTLRVEWPGLHDVVMKAPPVVTPAQVGTAAALYPATYTLDWLKSAGTLTLLAALLVAALLRVRPTDVGRIYVSTIYGLRWPIVAVLSVLALAWVMNYSGMTVTLALLFTVTGPLFPFFASFIGWLGVFLTGSDTASNNLFGGLQVIVAQQLGLEPILPAATNSSGGVTAKMISPQNLAIGTGVVGIPGSEGDILRRTLLWSLGLGALVGIIAMIQAYLVPWVIPLTTLP